MCLRKRNPVRNPWLHERKLLNPMLGPMQPQAMEKPRRQRTKTYVCLRLISGTKPATKSRARSLARSQSRRICTRKSAKTAPALSVPLVSCPGKTIHVSRRHLQREQSCRRKPVPSRRLVPLAKSGMGFSVRPLSRSSVCLPRQGLALLARPIAPSPPPERRITSSS